MAAGNFPAAFFISPTRTKYGILKQNAKKNVELVI